LWDTAVDEHRAVIVLSVADDSRVLLGSELVVGGDAPVAGRILRRFSAKRDDAVPDQDDVRIRDGFEHGLDGGGPVERNRRAPDDVNH
jgi:hypothetical protein